MLQAMRAEGPLRYGLLARAHAQHAVEGAAHALLAPEAAAPRDRSHAQVGFLHQLAGEAHADPFDELGGRASRLLNEEPRQRARA